MNVLGLVHFSHENENENDLLSTLSTRTFPHNRDILPTRLLSWREDSKRYIYVHACGGELLSADFDTDDPCSQIEAQQ